MRVRFFGRLRGLVDDGEADIALPPEVTTSEAARMWLGSDHPALLDRSIRIAVDDRLAIGDELLDGAREIAFLPPVSGG